MTKLFYSLAEVADLVGEPVSTIKFWEQDFPQIRPRRTPTGRRQYTEANLEAIRLIQSLIRQKGMTIQGAKDSLKKKRSSLELRQNTIYRLRNTLKKLEELRSAIAK